MGAGGARPNTGPKKNVKTQLKRVEALLERMQGSFGEGMSVLADAYVDLLERSIKAAREGDSQERRFLLKLVSDNIKLEDRGESPLASTLQQFNIDTQKVEIHGKDVASVGEDLDRDSPPTSSTK